MQHKLQQTTRFSSVSVPRVLHLQAPFRENHTSIVQDGVWGGKKKNRQTESAIMYSNHAKRFKEISKALFSSDSSTCPDCNSDTCYYILAFVFHKWNVYLLHLHL